MNKGLKFFSTGVLIKTVGIFIGLLVGSLVIAQGAIVFGAGILALVGVPFVLLSIYNYKYGINILFLYGSFLFIVGRILDVGLPFGILFDFLICLMFLSVLFSYKGNISINFKI